MVGEGVTVLVAFGVLVGVRDDVAVCDGVGDCAGCLEVAVTDGVTVGAEKGVTGAGDEVGDGVAALSFCRSCASPNSTITWAVGVIAGIEGLPVKPPK